MDNYKIIGFEYLYFSWGVCCKKTPKLFLSIGEIQIKLHFYVNKRYREKICSSSAKLKYENIL